MSYLFVDLLQELQLLLQGLPPVLGVDVSQSLRVQILQSNRGEGVVNRCVERVVVLVFMAVVPRGPV